MPSRPTRSSRLALQEHPDARDPHVHAIDARVAAGAHGLTFTYVLDADPAGLVVPPCAPAARTDGLWQHTCFEAFVAVAGQAAYTEFNFAPSRRWAAYAFERYRVRAEDAAEPGAWRAAPRITVRSCAQRLVLRAHVPAEAVPRCEAGQAMEFGLSAVIESRSGGLSLWALRHPGDKPDFHRRDGFVLTLANPTGSSCA